MGGAGGGGATHIATVSGLLKNLSGYKNTGGTNVSKEILIVAGGGGGLSTLSFNAGVGGGINGGIGMSYESGPNNPGGSQTAGYSFGQGQNGRSVSNCLTIGASGNCEGNGGGGGGWYGGYSTTSEARNSDSQGGGGSGYIGSSNLISGGGVTKHMGCYSCKTSTAAATRTNSNTNVSATPTADYSKIGNGYARITWLGSSI